jgi:hypothetical protein
MIFQIDTTKVKPGDSISLATCEQAIGHKCDESKEWQFALLQLLGVVQKQLKKEHRRELTVRIVGNELHVLTDQESATYNPKRFDAGLKLARRAHRRLMAVNVAKLTGADRDLYAKNVSNQAHKLSMLRKKEELPINPTERTTPVMSWPEKKKS